MDCNECKNKDGYIEELERQIKVSYRLYKDMERRIVYLESELEKNSIEFEE